MERLTIELQAKNW